MRPLRLLLIVGTLLAAGTAAAAPARRVLHVSLYPYIPDAAAAALSLKQGFELQHPDVVVDVTFNPNYYSPDPADKGVLYEDADVHEIDVVFLDDFVSRRKLAALPAAFVAGLPAFTPLAEAAATSGGRFVAAPHWMCADFLIYRADRLKLGPAPTLAELEHALPDGRGLLMDLKGIGALGEFYLSTLTADAPRRADAEARITPEPDPVILTRIERTLAMEPQGFGRNAAYGAREDFYARQFGRGGGDAFLGYSELTHDALDEAQTCRVEEHCVTAGEIGVAAFPFRDGVSRPTVWVDLFGVDARVHGRRLADAEAFIRYAVSLPVYRALLIPAAGAPPRYLLPATEAAFADPAILQAAPLYPKFKAIMDQGVVVSTPHLNAALHAVAAQIDKDLPPSH